MIARFRLRLHYAFTMRKSVFYLGALGLLAFEIANVWFIMPMPGSQRLPSVGFAYFLFTWRWAFRALFGAMMLASMKPAFSVASWRKVAPALALIVVGAVAYLTNFVMAADAMFKQPDVLTMAPVAQNKVDTARLVVGTVINGEARAYPVQFIGYHHQVRDSVGGKPVLVSYCTVCRTGRIFTPMVGGSLEDFRLVGMDHFNAMFEDRKTKSWWRQANGEAITGELKGTKLAELPSWQVSLSQWLALYPNSLIMQADPAYVSRYGKSFDYESGASRSDLTGTDTASWKEKSWVVGVTVGDASKAFDWNRLKKERVVNEEVGEKPVVVVLARDDKSYFVFERPDTATRFALRGDSLVAGRAMYSLAGSGPAGALKPLQASQEFWHSWRTFQPATTRY
jgi:hypothetical protein